MAKHDTELDLAPHIDPTWTEAFIVEARLREVPGTIIGEALGEVDDHCFTSGESALDAFGPAREYAATIASNHEPLPGPGLTWLLVPAFLQVAGVIVGLDGVTGLVQGDARPLSWATVLVLAVLGVALPVVGRFMSWAVRFMMGRPLAGVLLCGTVFAFIAAITVGAGLGSTGRVGIHAWTVFFVGLALLLAGTAGGVLASRLPSFNDPLVPAGSVRVPGRRRVSVTDFYGIACFALGAGLIVLLG